MSHSVDVHVGERLRYLRKNGGFSQSALAEKLGITFQQVQKYERGTNRISASKLYDAATVLGTPVIAFFEGLPNAGYSEAHSKRQSDSLLQRLNRAFESATEDQRARLVEISEILIGPRDA